MPPSLDDLEQLNIEIPDYLDGHHPFSKGQRPQFYKEILDPAEGKTSRTYFFEKHLVGLYWALGRSVPYAFRTRDGAIRSLDAGCVNFLCNRRDPELELIRDNEGYIVAVKPLEPLLARFEVMRAAAVKPFAVLARRFDLPFDIFAPVDERRRVLSQQVVREGQAIFRQDVCRAWGNCCAISRVGVSQVLEAAHIYPYLGNTTNDLRNAILLKADLHILFDAHLISLEYVGETLIARISMKLADTPYAKYEGKQIRLPADCAHQPAFDVVDYHMSKLRLADQIGMP